MLWYKSWLETRWRFIFGAVLLALSSAGTVLVYPQIKPLLPLASATEFSGEIGRRVNEAVQLSQTYDGYVWSQWFFQNMPTQWGLFAVLLGTGGLLAQGASGGALFTLSLPASRQKLIAVRAATGLGELLLLALVPAIVLPALSPAVDSSYSPIDALAYCLCVFTVGSVFFSLAFLLSTIFNDVWRPALIVLCLAAVLLFIEQVFRDAWPLRLYRVMTGESYFRGDGLPWKGLAAATLVSLAMLYGAARNIARRDF